MKGRGKTLEDGYLFQWLCSVRVRLEYMRAREHQPAASQTRSMRGCGSHFLVHVSRSRAEDGSPLSTRNGQSQLGRVGARRSLGP